MDGGCLLKNKNKYYFITAKLNSGKSLWNCKILWIKIINLWFDLKIIKVEIGNR